MQGGASIEFENNLSSNAADKLLNEIQTLVDQSLSAASAYDDAYNGGHEHGYDSGYKKGISDGYGAGYQEAKDAFWSYDREEYRINDYNVGYESGKRDVSDTATEQWQEGYDQGRINGRSEVSDEFRDKVLALETELTELRSSNRAWQRGAERPDAGVSESNADQAEAGQNLKGRYGALRRSLARLFHPDHISGSPFEKAIRQELFKEIWSEIERIEKSYAKKQE